MKVACHGFNLWPKGRVQESRNVENTYIYMYTHTHTHVKVWLEIIVHKLVPLETRPVFTTIRLIKLCPCTKIMVLVHGYSSVQSVYSVSMWALHLSAWHCTQVHGCCALQLVRMELSAKNCSLHSVILEAVIFLYEEPEAKSVLEILL
jgi:hypothetical protein